MFDISNPEGEYVDYLLGLEPIEGSMAKMKGRYYEDDSFHVNDDELSAFDMKFPFTIGHVTDTRLKT